MKIHNTLTKQVEEFKPLREGEVSFYTCGPTVYDYQTIGNLRTYVLYDTLRRVFEIQGFSVNYVMNITDVGHLTSDADEGEDKLEKGAKRSGQSVWDVAEHYTAAFKHDLERLNIPVPKIAKATDYISQQIAMVRIMLDKGYAYQTQEAIYFDVTRLKSYGRLTGQRLSDKEVAVRQEVVKDKNKRHPYDFAVWFFATGRFSGHSMRWPSPWGEGFPGWHLECSAIVHATLGDPIDIHAGAVDLVGTHHTNEMAQTEAAFGNQLANYWVHGEHLLVEGQRMGKSLGNFYTLNDVVDRGFSPLALRLLYLQAHYRSQLNFTWDSLEAAAVMLKSLQAWADLKFQQKTKEYSDTLDSIKAAVGNDLNTASALSLLSSLVSDTSSAPGQQTLDEMDRIFGLNLAGRQDIDSKSKALIAQREAAREKSQWQQSDELRQELLDSGIEINDTAAGAIWRRV